MNNLSITKQCKLTFIMFAMSLSTFPACWTAPSCPPDGCNWWKWAVESVARFFAISKLSLVLVQPWLCYDLPPDQTIHQIWGQNFFQFLFHYSFGGLYSLTDQANFKLEGRKKNHFLFLYSFGRLDSRTNQAIHQIGGQIFFSLFMFITRLVDSIHRPTKLSIKLEGTIFHFLFLYSFGQLYAWWWCWRRDKLDCNLLLDFSNTTIGQSNLPCIDPIPSNLFLAKSRYDWHLNFVWDLEMPYLYDGVLASGMMDAERFLLKTVEQ